MAKSSSFSYAFLTEILSSPKIKPYAQRLHPSAVLSVLKSAFDDVSQELWLAVSEQRRPDVNELIERIVGRLKSLLEIAEPLVMDARGRLFPNSFERLASAAVEEGAWVLSEPQTEYSRRQDAMREKDLLARLARLGGAESAAVFPNCESARVAILQSIELAKRNVVVARRDMFELDSGERLEHAFDVFPNLERREVGACDSVTLEDYARACDANTGLIWRYFGRRSPDGRRVAASDVAQLLARDGYAFKIIGEIEFVPLIDLGEYFDATIPTVSDRLKTGFDLVLCDGAQLIGGPSCGLVFGSRTAIKAINATPTARYSKLNRVATAMLNKTLALYENRETALESIPALRALSTSQANLESRANRLAALLETYPFVQIARAVEGRSALCANATFGTSPTWLVEARLREYSPAEFAAMLEKTSPKLLLRWTRDVVLIDMKTLLPEQDLIVSDLFGSLAEKNRENSPL